MRMALVSDIHGNPLAFAEVLRDIAARGGVEHYWILGDLVALGYDPVTVLQQIADLPHEKMVLRGNHDRYLVTGERAEAASAQIWEERERGYRWTLETLRAAGVARGIEGLPLEGRITLPNGMSLHGVHAAPGTDDGPGLHPRLSDQEVLAQVRADITVVGHTHVPMDRWVEGKRIINAGSVSNPMTSDLTATYVLLEANEQGYHADLRRVSYDVQAVIEAIQRSQYPSKEFLLQHFQGRIRSGWLPP